MHGTERNLKAACLGFFAVAFLAGAVAFGEAGKEDASSAPSLYEKRATWAETMLALRSAIQSRRQANADFKPFVSPIVRRGQSALRVSVQIGDLDQIWLTAGDAGDGAYLDHAVWGDPMLIAKDGTQKSLSDLEPISTRVGWASFLRDTNNDRKKIRIANKEFNRGLYAHAPSEIGYAVNRHYERLEAWVGIDDSAEAGGGSVEFRVLAGHDLLPPLWAQMAKDFPNQAAYMQRDAGNKHLAWLEAVPTDTGLEKRMIASALEGIGPSAQAMRAQLQALEESGAPGDDARWLALYDEAADARQVISAARSGLERMNLSALKESIEKTAQGPQTDEQWRLGALAKVADFEKEKDVYAKALEQDDLATLREAPQFMKQVAAFERDSMLKRLDVNEIVFAARRHDSDGHWYANFSYWSSDPDRKMYHPGGRLCRLNPHTGDLQLLIDDPQGGVRDPQVHYDGRKIVFSYRKGESPYYHLYEINIDGTGLRQLTDGPFDDLEPTYLPDGGIIFCSSRCNRYVNCWYVKVAVLYRCDGDGKNIRPLSANIEQDNTPWPLPDGRILYTRWEYVDRSQVHFHHLWTASPDGTGQMVYYGNMHGGIVMIDAKPIPGTDKIVASFSPGHGQLEHAGAITIVTPKRGPDDAGSARRVSKTEDFRDPYPLCEDLFLVARERQILLMNGSGETAEVYRLPDDPALEGMICQEPRPLAPRPCESLMQPRSQPEEPTGTLVVADVYQGREMEGVERGDIKKLLILETLPKPTNHSGYQEPLSAGGTFTLERILGTVPVEPDGSACIEVPAMRSLFFVALDENNLSVKRMQSFLTVMPGETLGCVGCHEQRTKTPVNAGAGGTLQAFKRPPSQIEPLGGVPDVFDFPRDIQPILDRHCLKCHDYDQRKGGVILSGDYGPIWSHSYYTLSMRQEFVDGRNTAFSSLPPRAIGTSASPLMRKLGAPGMGGEGHHGVRLSAQELNMVRYWIESAAPYPGTYGALDTGMIGKYDSKAGFDRRADLRWPGMRESIEALDRRCGECHAGATRLPTSPSDDIDMPWGMERYGSPRYPFSRHHVYNLTRPEKSMLLLAPLAREAGGYATRPSKRSAEEGHLIVFADANDPDYQRVLAAIRATREELFRIKRFDMPDFQPPKAYVREMQHFGILAADLDASAKIDPYATDQEYWRSHWWTPAGHAGPAR